MSTRNPIVPMTLAAGALVAISVLGAYAQVQDKAQQACINALNKGAATVAKTQGQEHVACVKGAGKGALIGTAQACLTADGKGKVAKAGGKVSAAETKSCVATPPDYAYTTAATMVNAAKQADLDLVGDVYGPNLDAAIISCATSKDGCACQQKVSKSVEALATVKFAEFVKCKKAALSAGGAASAAAIAACVNNAGTVGSIAADTKGKIGKTIAKLDATIAKSCDAPAVTAGAFPGDCTGLSGALLTACLDTRVECRVCQAINEMDGFFVNCDLFDNGILDATCASGTGPTPTPTPTQTATPTATPTFQPGTIFKGTLTRDNGEWVYSGMPGLPGGNTLCNATYPGTHVCEITELQAAQGLGELVGAFDNGGAVTRFWKVDPTEPNNRQCIDVPLTPTVRWFYATGHLSSFGVYMNFNAATGVIGSQMGPVGCLGTIASVGCCL